MVLTGDAMDFSAMVAYRLKSAKFLGSLLITICLISLRKPFTAIANNKLSSTFGLRTAFFCNLHK